MAQNRPPVHYLQWDNRWRDADYANPGEQATIGRSGCGPTCLAMAVEALTGRTFTPLDACNRAVQIGGKATGQGTYYGYFAKGFAEFGITCWQLSWSKAYHKPDHPVHAKALKLLKEGYWMIACMGPGHWTRGGHFVFMWWNDDRVEIFDPASTRWDRMHGDPKRFFNEVKYYFAIDARWYNRPVVPKRFPAEIMVAGDKVNVRSGPGTSNGVLYAVRRGERLTATSYKNGWYKTKLGWISADWAVPTPVSEKEEPDMDENRVKAIVRETFREMMDELAEKDATMPDKVKEAVKLGLISADNPRSFPTREQLAVVATNAQKNAREYTDEAVGAFEDKLSKAVKEALDQMTVNPDELGYEVQLVPKEVSADD